MNISFPKATNLMFQALAFMNGDILLFQIAYDSSIG